MYITIQQPTSVIYICEHLYLPSEPATHVSGEGMKLVGSGWYIMQLPVCRAFHTIVAIGRIFDTNFSLFNMMPM